MSIDNKIKPGYFVPWERFDELFNGIRGEQDRRHDEYISRFAKSDARVGHLQDLIEEHIAVDAKAFGEVHEAIERNNELTRVGTAAAEETRQSVAGLVTLYEAGQSVWALGKGLRTFLWVVFGICSGATGTFLLVMFWLGRGPLPVFH